jgi:hypothetical protein
VDCGLISFLAEVQAESMWLTECAERWQDITKLNADSPKVNWYASLIDEELEPVSLAWIQLLKDHQPVTMETRIKRQWQAPDSDPNGNPQWTDTHLLMNLYPDLDFEGKLSIMMCLTDIR